MNTVLKSFKKKKKKKKIGVPVTAQQKQIWPGTMPLWVRPLASFSGLRIQCCSELWYRSQTCLGHHCGCGLSCSSDSTPSLGTSICHRYSPKKKKKVFKEFPIPDLTQWARDPALPWTVVQVADAAQIPHCYGCGIYRPAATAPIWPPAWEPPYRAGTALKRQKRPKKSYIEIPFWSSCCGSVVNESN